MDAVSLWVIMSCKNSTARPHNDSSDSITALPVPLTKEELCLYPQYLYSNLLNYIFNLQKSIPYFS
jgi:hypothetical protein